MPDKKLTDNEIVKALECEIECNKGLKKHCIGCLLQKHYPYCEEKVIEYALDLINRLEARIGIYGTCNARKDEAIKHLEAENERLKEVNTKLMTDFNGLSGLIHRVKSEAYKEFWEELKRRNTMDERIVSVATGDNLLKELVGDNETVL